MENKTQQKYIRYNSFDTVELRYGYVQDKHYLFRGYILDYVVDDDTEKGFYDSVFLGQYRNSKYDFMGNYIRIQTTRMVLIEKYDYRLVGSIDLIVQ